MSTRELPPIGVVGLGQIGGSIARGLPIDADVVFYARTENVRRLGRASGLVATESLKELASRAETIFLAVPVDQIMPVLVELLPYLRPGQILTDVGSTKMHITESVKSLRLPSGVSFIGGHPMAGDTSSGFPGSDPELFENRSWVLTVESKSVLSNADALIRLMGIITGGLRANVMVLEPKDHDQVVASVSHLEHLIASALVALVHDTGNEKLATVLAAGSFRDATRVAMSSARMAVPFLESNPFLRETVDQFTQSLNRLSRLIPDEAAFLESWEFTRSWRSKLEGVKASMEDIEVDYSEELISKLIDFSLLGRTFSGIEVIGSRVRIKCRSI